MAGSAFRDVGVVLACGPQPVPLWRAIGALTDAEAAAFDAGQRAAHAALVQDLAESCRPPAICHDDPAQAPTGSGAVLGFRPGPLTGASSAPHELLVVDGDGELVATFPTAAWTAAHGWAHLRATEPLTQLPVRIEDLAARRTWTITPQRCELTVWMAGRSSVLHMGAGQRG
ncbi:hypothetical protein [Frankia sp. Cas4]|uniref:hypothetical protein n=1 Tax=Frankia sp. Cas4 TaxID=3073927 RepID=UPI002AD1FAE3|nr:hypothetical protein [Frankia sp. Cas4]